MENEQITQDKNAEKGEKELLEKSAFSSTVWPPKEAVELFGKGDSRIWTILMKDVLKCPREAKSVLEELLLTLPNPILVQEWSQTKWENYLRDLGCQTRVFSAAATLENRMCTLKQLWNKESAPIAIRMHSALDEGLGGALPKEKIPSVDLKNLFASLCNLGKWAQMVDLKPLEYPRLVRAAWPAEEMNSLLLLSGLKQELEKTSHPGWVHLVRAVLSLLDKKFDKALEREVEALKPCPGETIKSYVSRFKDYVDVLEMEDTEAGELYLNSLPKEAKFVCLIPSFAEIHRCLVNRSDAYQSCYVSLGNEAPSRKVGVKRPREYMKHEFDEGKRAHLLEIDRSNNSCFKCHMFGHQGRHCTAPLHERWENAEKVLQEWETKNVPKSGPSAAEKGKSNSNKGPSKYSAATVDSGVQNGDISVVNCSIRAMSSDEEECALSSLELDELEDERDGDFEFGLSDKLAENWVVAQDTEREIILRGLEGENVVKGELMFVDVTLQDVITVKALVDTGSQVTVICGKVLGEIESMTRTLALIEGCIFLKCANNKTEKGRLARLTICWCGFVKQHVFAVLEDLSYPVVLGMDILSRWPILSKPAITLEQMREKLSEFKLGDLEVTLQPQIEGTVLHQDHKALMALIQTELDINLATSKEYSTLCEICIEFKNPDDRMNDFRVAFAPQREPKLYMPMHYVHVDLLELPTETNKGHKSILVLIGQFSGFVLLRAVVSKSAAVVGEKMRRIFLEWGWPRMLKSDNGKEFCNNAVVEMLKLARVQHNVIIPHDHHSNGLVERANRNVRATIEKMIRDGNEAIRRDSWHELIPDVQHALNNRVHRVTQTTPFALMFGRESYFRYNQSVIDLSLEEARHLRRQFWKIFYEEVPKAVQKMNKSAMAKNYYPHKKSNFQIGDWVVVKNHGNSKGDDKYSSEPLQIIEVDENGIFSLRNERFFRKAPANHLKCSVEPDKVRFAKSSLESSVEELDAELVMEQEDKTNQRRSKRPKQKMDYVKMNGGVIASDNKRDKDYRL